MGARYGGSRRPGWKKHFETKKAFKEERANFETEIAFRNGRLAF